MHPIEMNKLQVLNDLIAQTIDVINQRNLAGIGAAPYGGLSHSPYLGAFPMGVPSATPGVRWLPQQQMGLAHTPFDPRFAAPVSPIPTIDPRWGINPYGQSALSHTPVVDPRWSFPTQAFGVPFPYLR